jgi:hypothetical protein
MALREPRNPHELHARFAHRVLSHVLHSSSHMRRTALFLVVLITGLVLLIEKTRDTPDEAPTAQLFEGK